MIPTSDPRTSATPQGAQRAWPVPNLDRPDGPRSTEIDHVAQLSAVVDYLRALQEHHRADRRLNGRARDAAVRVTALAHALQTATVPEPAPRLTSAPTGPETALSELETAFQRWLTDPAESDEIRLDDRNHSPRPLREVLEALRTSRRILSDEAAATLGLPARTTVGQAATELRLAVDHPAGPRCRSYRAAAYYLRDLDRIAFATTEVGNCWTPPDHA